jgi:signal transduction histidine kinase
VPAATVRADADAVTRVLVNLVDNATRYARTRVGLTIRTDGAWVRVSVTDDGPGIAAPDRERVFERFTRLDQARSRDEGGSGLGLAIVRRLVVAAGGQVRLDAVPDGPGLCAEVSWPAAPAA